MTKLKKGDVVSKYEPYSSTSQGTFVVLRVNKDNYAFLFDIEEGYQDSSNVINLNAIDKEKPFKVVSGKVDGYTGYAFKRGKKQYIAVGCRVFANLKEARKHWSNGEDGGHYNDEFYTEADRAYREQSNTKRLKATEKLVAKLKEIA